MAVALEQFVKQLADSGVIAPGKLENFVPPKAHPKDAQELARQLVQSKQLTKYQAQEIYQGRAKSLILGNYTIVDKIGAGGMGQVFKAEHRRMHRTVAIKMLPPAVTKDQVAVARFQREVEAAAKLRHTNIVAADDADEANGVHFLVMEFAEGSDLSALVKKNGPFPVAKAVNYMLQAALGLEYAHKHGVIHRDIKPANLLLNSEGTVKVLDMGLARIESGEDAGTQAELTGTGAVMGTVDYMAPEQALSTKHADARADIYSLGCSLHYLITGKAAYDGDTLMAKLLAHRDKPIPSLGPSVPEQVQAVFEKMIAKNIEARYQTMSDVTAALQECVAATSTSGTRQPISEPSPSNGNLSFLAEATAHSPRHGQTKQAKPIKVEAKWAKKFSGWNRKKRLLIGGAVGGGLLAAAILAAVVFKLRTKDGTLIVEVNQPDAVVQVLGADGTMEITQRGGKGAITIAVDPGKHRLKVEKDGFQFFAQDFEMDSGGTATIKARLEPAKAATVPVDLDRSVAQWWLKQRQELQRSAPKISHGFLFVEAAGQTNGIYSYKDLPSGAFQITRLGMSTTSDADLAKIARLQRLSELNLSDSNVSDAGIEHLNGATALARIVLSGTRVTSAGVAALQKALPNCKIEWSAAAKPVATLDDPAFQQWMTTVAAMPAEKQVDAVVKKLQELNPGFDGKIGPRIDNGVVRGLTFSTASVTDISPVRALVALRILSCRAGKLADLSPLRGMPLAYLDVGANPLLSDLSALEEVPLTTLHCNYTKVSDLSPLKRLNVTELYCDHTNVSDLSPLSGTPLKVLLVENTSVSDLSPLKALSLIGIVLTPKNIVKGLDVIRHMSSLKNIGTDYQRENTFPADEFWKKYDAGEFGKPDLKAATPDHKPITTFNDPAFQQWMTEVATLFAEPQVKAVVKKLQELNPGFDGKETHRIEKGVVTELQFNTKNVTDISPVRALAGLRVLTCGGSRTFSDLSPLRGMHLTRLDCHYTRVSDLSPLAGMPLTYFDCGDTQVSDLSQLKGMPLTFLHCGSTLVSDLTLINGMPLTSLWFDHTKVFDLSPLQRLNLAKVAFTPVKISKGIDSIRQMKSLTSIGIGPEDGKQFKPDEFWRKYDAGEFGKPAAALKSTLDDPAFQEWMKTVAAMPAEKQVDAVAKKLQELNPGFDGKLTGVNGDDRPPTIEDGVVIKLGLLTDNVSDISPLRALARLKLLRCGGSREAARKLSDLSPLRGLPLTWLLCGFSQVSDLSPLVGMRLEKLECFNTNVSDLSPLAGMPLGTLWIHETKIGDLTPLAGMKLNEVVFTPGDIRVGLDILRQMQSIQNIGARGNAMMEPEQFWKRYDAGEFGKPNTTLDDPAFQQWMKGVAILSAEKQVDAVARKLQDLNPGFDGAVVPKFEGGAVKELQFVTDDVTDISPVRALASLTSLSCGDSGGYRGKLSDLSPLAGMKLEKLACGGTKIADLSPLQGMPLTELQCNGTKIASLLPLQGMRLKFLKCGTTHVSDLSPLRGMPLEYLSFYSTQVSDLSPLKGMPLTHLECNGTAVSDLSPLAGMHLTDIVFTPKSIDRGIESLRQMQSLKTIHTQKEKFSRNVFWKKYDAGEFGKPDSKAGGQDHYPTGTPR